MRRIYECDKNPKHLMSCDEEVEEDRLECGYCGGAFVLVSKLKVASDDQ